jgi:Flp pilus assembly protein CpaB
VSPIAPRRSGGLSTILSGPPVALVAVVAAVVVFGVLWGLGILDLSAWGTREPSTAGLIAVPTPARRIPAYARVTRDHIWDARNQRLSVVYLPPQSVTKEMLIRLSDVLGRVLNHEKAPGYVFTSDDFLPKGTREGLVGGIPAGKRAVRVSGDKIDGLHGLNPGDRFDLLATLPIDASRGGGVGLNMGGVYGQEINLEAQLSNWQKQATVRVMVQNAIIIEPMSVRGVPMFQSSLTEGGVTRMRPVQEAVIAIEPEEVARLTEALAVDAKITAVPRSGRPDDKIDSRTPDLYPVSPFNRSAAGGGLDPGTGAPDSSFRMVETIMGQKRELKPVPRR